MKCQARWSTIEIKFSGRNINNLRYTDDTTLMVESEEQKSLLRKVKGYGLSFGLRICVLSHFSCVWLLATLWTVAHQVLLSMGFSRQENWSELPRLPPGDLPNPGIEPASPTASAFQSDCLPLSHCGSPINSLATVKSQLPLGDWTRTLWMRIGESTDLVNCKQWFLSVVIQLTLTSSFYKLSSSQVCVCFCACVHMSKLCLYFT